jgi:hypothetical protein
MGNKPWIFRRRTISTIHRNYSSMKDQLTGGTIFYCH